jgi:hypothetical protein
MIAVSPTRYCNVALYRFVSAGRVESSGQDRVLIMLDVADKVRVVATAFCRLFKQSFA